MASMMTRTRAVALAAGVVAALFTVLVVHPARAQSMSVTIVNFSFQPATLTIPVGTTVTWTNQDTAPHTSTSDTGVWNSGTLSTGQSYSRTFSQPGTFPYHCNVHPNMHGTVVVEAAATAVPTSAASTATPSTAATSTPSAAATATSAPLSAHPAVPHAFLDLHMGAAQNLQQMSWLGYYDGWKDTYLNTDVSSKTQAQAMHVNYSAALARVPMGTSPAIYLVRGRAAANQLAVFGSEPGEADYSPIWHEVVVQWKAAAAPKLLVSDNQIADLAKKGKLTMRANGVMLNCPIVKVRK